MLKIQKAEYIGDYKILLAFNNGHTGTVNLEETIQNDNRAIFLRIKDKNVFRSFTITHNTISWFDELDVAPEYLFYLAFTGNSEFHEQFREWGYTS